MKYLRFTGLCVAALVGLTVLTAVASARENEGGKGLACRVIRVPAPANYHGDPYAKYLYDGNVQAWVPPIPPGYTGKTVVMVETEVCDEPDGASK
jgi:hypothetical protein